MPGMDHTGPAGQGPKTGRQMGKCGNKTENTEDSNFPQRRRLRLHSSDNNSPTPGRGHRGSGRCSGRGMGRGRGNGNFN